jgi:undecaprenyl-diphosphatase
MNIIDSILLGILEGISEFLPISSTGHLILASRILGIPATEFLKSFEIAIQLGAILSVVALYYRKFLDLRIITRLIAAFAPTALIGLAAYPFLKRYLLENDVLVAYSLIIGGVLLVAFEYFHKETPEAAEDIRLISHKRVAVIGLFQAIAIIPGVSRSAATILGGLGLGFRRRMIAEFSFLLAVPTMAAATGLDLLRSAGGFTPGELLILAVGFTVSFIVALGSIFFLLEFIKKHTFIPFGIYRIILGLAFLALWYT